MAKTEKTPDNAPAYLTDPGASVAERSNWESQFASALNGSFRQYSGPTALSLRAAGPQPLHTWLSIVEDVGRKLKLSRRMKMFMIMSKEWQQRLFASEDYETRKKLAADMAGSLASAAYNEHVLNLLHEHGFAKKMWLTRHDKSVRKAHRELDGKTVPIDSTFHSEGFEMQCPGDSTTAPPHLWMRCRCTLLGRKR